MDGARQVSSVWSISGIGWSRSGPRWRSWRLPSWSTVSVHRSARNAGERPWDSARIKRRLVKDCYRFISFSFPIQVSLVACQYSLEPILSSAIRDSPVGHRLKRHSGRTPFGAPPGTSMVINYGLPDDGTLAVVCWCPDGCLNGRSRVANSSVCVTFAVFLSRPNTPLCSSNHHVRLHFAAVL